MLNPRTIMVIGMSWIVSLVAGPVLAQSQTQRSVSVMGTCLRSAPPDRASITVTAQAVDKDIQKAAKSATESYESFKKSVQKLKLKDLEISTSEYNLQELREWQKDRQVSKGFQSRMGMNIKTSEISRIGEVIALASRQGLRDVGDLRMFLSEEKRKTEHEACLVEAIQNAQAKAEIMAKAASAKLGRVHYVSENGDLDAPRPRPVPFAKTMSADMASIEMAPPSIDAGPMSLSVQVSVSYALE